MQRYSLGIVGNDKDSQSPVLRLGVWPRQRPPPVLRLGPVESTIHRPRWPAEGHSRAASGSAGGPGVTVRRRSRSLRLAPWRPLGGGDFVRVSFATDTVPQAASRRPGTGRYESDSESIIVNTVTLVNSRPWPKTGLSDSRGQGTTSQ
jgi:hypothetical protein